MAVASTLAGIAFSNAGVGLVHAMSHPLGGHFDIPHGVANAVLLPYVMGFNLIARVEKYAQVGEVLGARVEGLSPWDAARRAKEAVLQLSSDIGSPLHLSEVGVKGERIGRVVEDALQMKRAIGWNPRVVSQEEIERIYREAL
jgi:alcohol dehydrogenase class IV